MNGTNRLLVALDEFPLGALYRMILGFFIIPLFSRWSGGNVSGGQFLMVFVGILLGLRLVPALFRHSLPFSKEVRTVWAEKRQLAKAYDSFQWRKVFWLGLGLSSYIGFARRSRPMELLVTLICLIGGAAGLLVWRRVRPPGAGSLTTELKIKADTK